MEALWGMLVKLREESWRQLDVSVFKKSDFKVYILGKKKLVVQIVKNPPCPCRRPRFGPWVGKRIPWTEEPGGLQSMGLQRVKHDLSDLAYAPAHGPTVHGVATVRHD